MVEAKPDPNMQRNISLQSSVEMLIQKWYTKMCREVVKDIQLFMYLVHIVR